MVQIIDPRPDRLFRIGPHHLVFELKQLRLQSVNLALHFLLQVVYFVVCLSLHQCRRLCLRHLHLHTCQLFDQVSQLVCHFLLLRLSGLQQSCKLLLVNSLQPHNLNLSLEVLLLGLMFT